MIYFLLGVLVGVIISYIWRLVKKQSTDGVLVIERTGVDKVTFQFLFENLVDLTKKRHVTVDVKKIGDFSQ